MTNFYNLDESMQKKAIDTVRKDDSYINLLSIQKALYLFMF